MIRYWVQINDIIVFFTTITSWFAQACVELLIRLVLSVDTVFCT